MVRSLKLKMALATTGIFVALLAAVSTVGMSAVKEQVRDIVGAEQFSLVTRVAAEIDKNITAAQRALVAEANSVPGGLLDRPEEAQRFLQDRAALKSLFGDVVLLDATLKVVAEVPKRERIGQSFAGLPHLQATLSSGLPQISPPHASSRIDGPYVVFTAPITDPRGAVTGVLAGSIALFGHNFLGDLAAARVGRTGMFTLLGRDRTIIVSRDKERILTQGPPSGVSPYFDHATAGQESWEEATDSRGLHAMFSYVSLRTAPWVLVGSLPVEEAFAPVARAEQRVTYLALTAALLLLPAVWFACFRLLSPLGGLRDAIRRSRADPDRIHSTGIRQNDEIGDLASDFDAMMAERHAADTALREASAALAVREARFRAFMDHSAAPMFIKDLEGRYILVNQKFTTCFGVPAENVLGRRDDEIFRPAIAGHFLANDQQVIARGAPIEIVEGARYVDGWHASIVTKFPIQDGNGRMTGLGGIVIDITERRNAERALQLSEKRLRMITDNLPAMIAYVDRHERYQFVNPTVERWFGVSPSAFLGRTVREMRGESAYGVLGQHIRRALEGETVAFDYESVAAGVTRHLNVQCIPDMNESGSCDGIFVLVNDITQLKHSERTLRQSEARFRAIGDASPSGIFVADLDGRGTYVNTRYSEITGMTSEQSLGAGWSDHVHPADRDRVLESWRSAVRERRPFEATYRYVLEDAVSVWAHVKANPFREGDSVIGYVGTVEDITERKHAEQRLSRMAHNDPLTGLPNRILFNDRLTSALARQSRTTHAIALMYLDIDRFKSVNDTLGHTAGDEVLKVFAERLTRTVRAADTVARLGGDEFVIILEELHRPEDACLVAKKIIQTMQEAVFIGEQPLIITTSIGIAYSGQAGGETLLEQADKALYAAKRAGRNRYEIFGPRAANVVALPLSGRVK